jgi:hypothetical protein
VGLLIIRASDQQSKVHHTQCEENPVDQVCLHLELEHEHAKDNEVDEGAMNDSLHPVVVVGCLCVFVCYLSTYSVSKLFNLLMVFVHFIDIIQDAHEYE